MRPATVTALRERLSGGGALTVVEGAMGLFDGAADGTASAADFAALTGWPVILVVDARGQAQSAGALLSGFARHRADVAVAGVIFNRIGGPAHESALRLAAEPLGIPVLGCIPRAADLVLPERHLGLVQATEHADLEAFLDRLADRLETRLDIDRLLDLARPARQPSSTGAAGALLPLGQRIAVACDAAFAFSYAGTARCLAQFGRRDRRSSRRWPMRRRRRRAMRSICPVAIPSSMPGDWRRASASSRGCVAQQREARSCSANAAAI